jgi:WD40 repeat protein
VIIKGGKKVICGTQEGALTIWSWGDWGDQNDRFMGHPESIDALLKLDEGTIITGSSDGLVRVVEIQPNRLLGVLGDHDGFPVEDLQFSRDRGLIGSLSHDDIVRMWDVSILHEEEGSDEDEEEMDIDVNGIMAAGGLNESENENENEGSDDDWSDMDDEGEEEEEEEKGGKKKRKESIDSDDSGGDDSGGDDSDDEDDEGDEDYGRGLKKFKTESEKFFVDL